MTSLRPADTATSTKCENGAAPFVTGSLWRTPAGKTADAATAEIVLRKSRRGHVGGFGHRELGTLIVGYHLRLVCKVRAHDRGSWTLDGSDLTDVEPRVDALKLSRIESTHPDRSAGQFGRCHREDLMLPQGLTSKPPSTYGDVT